MKRKIYCSLALFLVLLCCGCNGDVTRALRHSGFSINGDFICERFFPKKKDDTSYDKIKFMTDSHIINESGILYEVSFGQLYANKSNCKKAETTIEVVAIFDGKIAKTSDGRYYYLIASNGVVPYTEVTASDNSYAIYDILLRPDGTKKVITANSSSGLYYVLKNDGNVYGYTLSRPDRNTPIQITETSIIYNKDDYGGNDIIDFNYSGESGTTFIKTINKAYKMDAKNSDECQKYVDVKCDYSMSEFTAYEENLDNIIAYNGKNIITKYGKLFSANN